MEKSKLESPLVIVPVGNASVSRENTNWVCNEYYYTLVYGGAVDTFVYHIKVEPNHPFPVLTIALFNPIPENQGIKLSGRPYKGKEKGDEHYMGCLASKLSTIYAITDREVTSIELLANVAPKVYVIDNDKRGRSGPFFELTQSTAV